MVTKNHTTNCFFDFAPCLPKVNQRTLLVTFARKWMPLTMWCVAWFGPICTILKNVKNTHRGMLLLVKLQASACNFTLPHGYFSRFLNCINGTKSRKAPQYVRWKLKTKNLLPWLIILFHYQFSLITYIFWLWHHHECYSHTLTCNIGYNLPTSKS